ncbi:hypothetical protein [Streptomyces sp. NPDC051310]|uniref:hypothetical protein n=1 Tax=Streptomyces sp. NPDC051310 TaxID=3365649 RepID=UPI0037BC8387
MTDYPEIAARFERETAGHQMTVLHDEGLYRHLLFRTPGHGFYWFEIITTPGQLVFSGDGESYVFRRMDDMLQFFRTGLRRDGSIDINPQYWSEKLASDRDSVTKYDREIVERLVKERVVEGIREGWAPRGIGKAVHEDVLGSEYLETEDEARRVLYEFEYGAKYMPKCTCGKSGPQVGATWEAARWRDQHRKENGTQHKVSIDRVAGFNFDDVSEWDLRDYDWWFLWACHAVVAGIRRYDKVRRYGLQQLATPTTKAAVS